jgi:AcrR family transcriptional regulator
MPRAAREQLMVEVATRAFAEHGYHSSSMEDIAEGAGVTKPMVYAYFGSKEGLYVACLERASLPLIEQVGIDRSNLPTDRQHWEGILAFLTFVSDNREGWLRLYLDAQGIGGEAAEASDRLRAAFARVVAQMIADAAEREGVDSDLSEHIDPIAHAFVGAAEATLRWWVEHPEEPIDLVAARLMNFAWQGFGNLIAGNIWMPELIFREPAG